MIKINRPSFSRADLSSVLEKIINSTEDKENSRGFEKEFCKKFGYKQCYGVASLGQSLYVLLRSFTVPIRIILPILTPYRRVQELKMVGYDIEFYDLELIDSAIVVPSQEAERLAESLQAHSDTLHVIIAPSFCGEYPPLPHLDPSLQTHSIRLLYTPETQAQDHLSAPPSRSIDVFTLLHNNYISALGGALIATSSSSFGGTYPVLRERLYDELSPLTTALAQAQLAQYDAFITRFTKIRDTYMQSATSSGVNTLSYACYDRSVLQSFPIFSTHAKEAYKFIYSQGVEAEYMFKESYIAYELEHIEANDTAFFDRFKGSITLLQTCLSLPLNPSLSNAEEQKIGSIVSALPV